ncbi:MAG: hypothetical protein E6I89_14245 [Chloroflexi bacterium]|nr:MAG: hypothetical protein E6I89_14245 [Chloroflexota bacterium]
MRVPGFPRFGPAIVMLAAAASATFLFLHAPPVRAECGGTASGATPCPPSPTPIPVNAFLSLDVTNGPANTVVNVTGGQFLPNEQVTLYWDQPDKVAGGATADASGSFNTRVKPFSADAPGVHKLCASVPPNPCANFALESATPTPSASPSPSESPSASPAVGPTVTPIASPVAATLNGFDVISKPPFVFLPIAGAVAIALALGYWLVSMVRRPRTVALPAAAVVHRATRPDYSAGFGTPPPTSAVAPDPSAWPEQPPQAPPAPAEQPPGSEPQLPAAEWGPPTEWGTGVPDGGYPELSAPEEPDD